MTGVQTCALPIFLYSSYQRQQVAPKPLGPTGNGGTYHTPEGPGGSGDDGGSPGGVVHQCQLPEAAAVVIATHHALQPVAAHQDVEGPSEEEDGSSRKRAGKNELQVFAVPTTATLGPTRRRGRRLGGAGASCCSPQRMNLLPERERERV